MTIDTNALSKACLREVEGGLAGCQIALAYGGRVVFSESHGAVGPKTRFWVASATKPIVSSAIWILMSEAGLDIRSPVSAYVPEFSENGKQNVTVEQVMLMTCGFPNAPMSAAEGNDPARRIARLASWTLEFEPGTQYAYHGMSAHWVLAELIERLGGQDFRDFVEERITAPLGLPRLLGIAREDQTDIAQLAESASIDTRSAYDYAEKIEVGEPGGGGVMTASMLSLFYQGLLHNPGQLWAPAILSDGVGNVRCTLPDPLLGQPANRTLGVVVGPGFGATWTDSETAYGWPGAGGQIGFAEPRNGISFAFLQVGDNDPVSQFIRGVKMSNLALRSAA